MKLLNIINIYLGDENNPDRLTDETLRGRVCEEFRGVYLKYNTEFKLWVVEVVFLESNTTIRFTELLGAETFYNDIFEWASDAHPGRWTIDTREYSAL